MKTKILLVAIFSAMAFCANAQNNTVYQTTQATPGGSNAIFGVGAGAAITTGGLNTIVGTSAGSNVNTGEYNVIMGFAAGLGINGTSGKHNTVIGGRYAGQNLTSEMNVFIGSESGSLNPSTTASTAMGCTFVGGKSGAAVTAGQFNTGIGYQAGNAVSGNYNGGLGFSAGSSVSGNANYGVGFQAGSGTTGSNNNAIGYQAGVNVTGSSNFIGGTGAGAGMSSAASIAIGSGAGNSSGGQFNVILGQEAGQSMTGKNNVAIGFRSGQGGISGDYNTYLGYVYLPSAATATTFGNNSSQVVIISDGGGTPRFTVNANGYAGIGLGNNLPQNRLELNSTSAVAGTTGLRFRNYTAPGTLPASGGKVLTLNANGDVILAADAVGAGGVTVNSGTNTTVTGNGTTTPYVVNAKNIYTHDGTLNTTVLADSPTPGQRRVEMDNNNLFFDRSGDDDDKGKIYIGTVPSYPISTGDYNLYVEGGILTEKVKVALRFTGGNWADYVFADDYKLMPLSEVESFIKENKHLPGVASAEELSKTGLDLGAMQAKQMEKIEELTLHLIEQNKTVEKQSSKIGELTSHLAEQNKTIEKQSSEIEELQKLVKDLVGQKN